METMTYYLFYSNHYDRPSFNLGITYLYILYLLCPKNTLS